MQKVRAEPYWEKEASLTRTCERSESATPSENTRQASQNTSPNNKKTKKQKTGGGARHVALAALRPPRRSRRAALATHPRN